MRSRSIHHWKDKRGYLQPPTPATLPSLITSLPKLRGELVPQDPNDEPASVLLARIRAKRAAAGMDKPRRGCRRTG